MGGRKNGAVPPTSILPHKGGGSIPLAWPVASGSWNGGRLTLPESRSSYAAHGILIGRRVGFPSRHDRRGRPFSHARRETGTLRRFPLGLFLPLPAPGRDRLESAPALSSS